MAEYIKQEMCDLNGTGEKPVYYRMKIQRNMEEHGYGGFRGTDHLPRIGLEQG